MSGLTKSRAWEALEAHRTTMSDVHMRDLFYADKHRFDKFSLPLPGLLLDYSKNRVTSETMRLLFELLNAQNFDKWRSAMFSGEKINASENRAVLHVALRARQKPEIVKVLEQMRHFSETVRSGAWKGYGGHPVRDIVHIGIGGSALGPQFVTEALAAFGHPQIGIHFVSNVDGTHIVETLAKCDPETTLFIVASKTFTTQETMTNAQTARKWLLDQFNGDMGCVSRHFVAVSTNEGAVAEFGIDPKNMFVFWDWVGGRYSLWSAIGLPIAISAGMDRFEELLSGAHEMDEHFRTAAPERNMPVILALLGVWYRNFWNAQSCAVLPYDQYLSLLPRWLQQVDMESNGKRIDRDGNTVDYDTGPIVFGDAGTDAQHSFFQLLHQGTTLIPCDFIAPIHSHHHADGHQQILLANFLAQTEALMKGRAHKDPSRAFDGNRPSNTLLADRFDAKTLGMLLALYEHKVFVQGIVWNINSFDQFGVELGKEMASALLPEIKTGETGLHDCSTTGLLEWIRNSRPGRIV